MERNVRCIWLQAPPVFLKQVADLSQIKKKCHCYMGQFILPLRQRCHNSMVQIVAACRWNCYSPISQWRQFILAKNLPQWFRSWSCLHQGSWQNCWWVQMETEVNHHGSLQDCYSWLERQPREWEPVWIHCHGNDLKEAALPEIPPYNITWEGNFACRIQLDLRQDQILCSFHLPASFYPAQH